MAICVHTVEKLNRTPPKQTKTALKTKLIP